MTDINDLIYGSAADIPEPPALPTGHWRFKGKAVTGKTRKDGTTVALLTMEPLEAMDDVDPVEADAWQDAANGETAQFHEFRDGPAVKRTCKALGLERLADIVDTEFVACVTHDPKKDGDGVWLRYKDFAPVTD